MDFYYINISNGKDDCIFEHRTRGRMAFNEVNPRSITFDTIENAAVIESADLEEFYEIFFIVPSKMITTYRLSNK